MAIARGAGAVVSASTTGFSLTLPSVDAGSGTGRFLIVVIMSTNDSITGAAYNATPMTLLDKTTAASAFIQFWGLPNPSVDSNDLIISNSNFNFMQAVAFTYTGVDTVTYPDAVTASTDNATFATSLSMSTTTVADNAWTIYGVHCANAVSEAVAGTGSTLVGQLFSGSQGSVNLFDGGPHTPAGAESMQATHGSNTNWRGVMVSLGPADGAPPPPGTGSGNMLLLCG